jgi:hypothetical protein
MNRKWRVFVLAVAVSCAGCAARVKNVTDLPTGVTQQQAQNWDAAVRNLHEIATTTSNIRQAIIGLRNAGAFPNNDAYAAALQGVARIDQIQLAASDLLKQQPQAFGQPQKQQIALYMNLITGEIEKLNAAGATGTKNPETVKQFNDLLTSLTNLVKITLALTS